MNGQTTLVEIIVRVHFRRTVEERATKGLQEGLVVVHHLGKTEIRELDNERLVGGDQNIVRLNISVGNFALVEIIQSIKDLSSYRLGQQLWHRTMLIHVAGKFSTRDVLHDDIQVAWLVLVIDVLDDIRLTQPSVRSRPPRESKTYMAEILNDFQLVVDLLIKNSVLHKLALFKLFHRKDLAVMLGGKFVDHRKGTFADVPNDVIILASIPVHTVMALNGSRGKQGQ